MEDYPFEYQALQEQTKASIPAPVIHPDTLMVFLCNYKGEEAGIALYESAAHLPVFVCKHIYQ